MIFKKSLIVYVILIIFLSSVFMITNTSGKYPSTLLNDIDLDFWNDDWSFRQEIKIPIETYSENTKFQPIDIKVKFDNPCWAIDNNMHSIRICCWDGKYWHELESQIYSLNYSSNNHISDCGLVFLVPEFANGKEQYFIYYDNEEKQIPNYPDHVSIEDSYYYFEPISGISVEGDYYKIIEDGYIIYAVGQKGQVMDRKLSQIVIKVKYQIDKFDIMNSDILTSFSFSYQNGLEDADEISSDHTLISKNIVIDGNLMIEFAIVSSSSTGHLLTSNIYKYYYCPTTTKRMNVHVKHEVLEDSHIKGIKNIDGRYGSIISYHSDSPTLQRMCFGDILPYMHVYGENNRIKEYKLNTNPETKNRDWIVSYADDCDIGSEAWISYDEGKFGKTHGILFSSYKDIIKRGTNERDGFEVKVAESEYLNIVNTEIDYASIAFGRNAFETDGSHDLTIPDDLIVEFDAEFITIEEGTYDDISKEGKIYQDLIKHRFKISDEIFDGEQNIHTLTVIPHLSGRVWSYPRLVERFNLSLPVTWVELYQNGTMISSGIAFKPIIGWHVIKFPKLPPGEYTIKIFRKIGDDYKKYVGFGSVTILGDIDLHIYCTWEKSIELISKDQYNNFIVDIELELYKNDHMVFKNNTCKSRNTFLLVPFNIFDSYTISGTEDITIKAPFNFLNPYILKAIYKGFLVYYNEIHMFQKFIELNLNLYDLTIEVKDDLGLSPGVDVRPYLISSEMEYPKDLEPEEMGNGIYLFENLPSAKYELYISYAGYTDKKTIIIPKSGDITDVKFTAEFNLKIELLNSRGEIISNNNQKLDILRDGEKIHRLISSSKLISLPPGSYLINVYSNENELIGSKNIEISSSRNIKIVTMLDSLLPIVITGLVIIFLLEIFILFIFKKISLNSFLKIFAMSLIIISIFQPWWLFNASNDSVNIEKTSTMFIIPQTMIDSININDKLYLDLSTIPELFTDFVGILLFIIFSGFILIGISFIPNFVLRKRFSLGLISASILFLILVAAAFSFGMSTITELSLGSLQGEGKIDIILPTGDSTYMNSNWGLGFGFYLCIFSAVVLIIAGLIDYILEKKEIKI